MMSLEPFGLPETPFTKGRPRERRCSVCCTLGCMSAAAISTSETWIQTRIVTLELG